MLPSPFSQLPPIALRSIQLSAGKTLFRMGDQPKGFYYVAEGEVHLLRHLESGDTLPIHRAFAGDFFAEASLFSEGYHCDAVAQSDSKLVMIDRVETLKFLDDHPVFAREVTAHLARQVQNYRRLLELRSIRSAKDRVLAAVQEGLLKGQIKSFATQIGLTQEATYRALSELVQTGRLEKPERGIYLLKYQRP